MKHLFALTLLIGSFFTYAVTQPGGHSLEFNSPGEGFVKTESGDAWEHTEDNASLKGILTAKSVEDMKAEIDVALSLMTDVEVISKGDAQLGPHKGYLLKMKKAIGKEYIVQYAFYFPVGHGMTGNMTATFPETLTEKYAEAMLDAMGTARMSHNH